MEKELEYVGRKGVGIMEDGESMRIGFAKCAEGK